MAVLALLKLALTDPHDRSTPVLMLFVAVLGAVLYRFSARLARERERALALAQEATDKLEVVLRGVNDGITMQDRTGKLVYANDAAARIVGFPSAADLVAAPPGEVMRRFELLDASGASLPLERLPNRAIFAGATPEEALVQFRVRGEEGYFWATVNANGVLGPDGQLRFVVNVFRDVTAERRQAERREFLARATSELNASLDYASTLGTVARLAVPRIADWCAVDIVENGNVRRLAVAHVDPSKVQWVAELERRYPSDPDAPRGMHHILRTGSAEMIPRIPAELIDAVAKDAEHLRLIRELELRSYIGVPLTRGGTTFGVISLVMAESKREYDESDLEFASELADRAAIAVENAQLFRSAEVARSAAVQASRAKDDFLAMLGHELRNPLAPIVTALELMQRRPEESNERERRVIERQVRHVVRLVDDLLDVHRIVRGRVVLAKERVELADLVQKALELASPLFEERQHQLHVSVPQGLSILSDGVRLTQVVTNLLTNAAKYTEPHGHVWLQVESERDTVSIRVRDNGMGIAPDMLSVIFDLFVQAPQTIDRAQGGLGLGLTIVQNLVRLFGGSVSAHSAGHNQGSEFVVRLPNTPALQGVPSPSEPPPAPAPVRTGTTVLVVDDNADALEMLVEALQMLGYDPHPAADAPAALNVARQTMPSLALLDIGLPVIDGYELGRQLRALPGLEQIKLVAVTGYGQPSDRERSSAAGFAAHLVKPVELRALSSLINELTS